MLIARFLFEYMKYWQRSHFNFEKISESDWEEFFTAVEKNPALAENGKDLLKEYMAGKKTLKQVLDAVATTKKSDMNPDPRIKKMISKYQGKVKPENRHKWIMGKLMAEFRGVIRGEEIGKILSKLL